MKTLAGFSVRRRRLLSSLGRLIFWFGSALLFAVSLAIGVVLHLDLPAGRRLAARVLTRVLSSTFYGKVHIGELSRITPDGLIAKDLSVTDTSENTVLTLSEVQVRADLVEFVRTLLFESGLLEGERSTLLIRHVRVERADGNILFDPKTGAVTIAHALTPVPGPPSTEPEAEPSRLRVYLPVIEIGRVFARSTLGDGPTLEAELSSILGSVLVSPKGAAIDVARFGLLVRGVGGTDAEGIATLHIRAPGPIWGSFDGYFGNLPLNVSAGFDGQRLKLSGDVIRAKPEDVRALFSDWPLEDTASAHVELHGKLPRLEAKLSGTVGQAKVEAEGELTLEGDVGADLTARVQGFSLSSLHEDAPVTKLAADAYVSIWNRQGTLTVDFNGKTEPSTILDLSVPAVDANGTFDGQTVRGRATLHEPGMPLKVDFTVDSEGVVELDVLARRFRLEQAPRIQELVKVRGSAEGSAKVHISGDKLEASSEAKLENVELGDVTLAQARFSGSASGNISNPEALAVSGKLVGKNAAVPNLHFDDLSATAKGTPRKLSVDLSGSDRFGPNVEASGSVSLAGPPKVSGLELELERRGAKLKGTVAEIDLSGDKLKVHGIRLSGAGGTLQGLVEIGDDELTVKAEGARVNLDEIARALGLPRHLLAGTLDVDADIEVSRASQKGTLRVTLRDGSVGVLDGVSLRLFAELDQQALTGELSAYVPRLASAAARWDAKLYGLATRRESWEKITGKLDTQLTSLELDELEGLLAKSLGIERLRGTLLARVELERSEPDAFPNVEALVASQGLALALEPPEGQPSGRAISGVDFHLGSSLEGESGKLDATLRLIDAGGILLSTSAETSFDLPEAYADPDGVLSQVLTTPFNAVLTIDGRKLESLPELLRPPGIGGAVSGRLMVSGTLREPVFASNLTVESLRALNEEVALPVDVRAMAQYERVSGRFGISAEVYHEARRVSLLSAQGDVPWERAVLDQEGARPVTGTARLVLEGLPLSLLGPLTGGRVTGSLSGTAALGWTEDRPQLSGSLTLKDTEIEGAPIGTGQINVRADRRALNTMARFRTLEGSLDASLLAALSWTEGVPGIDDTRPMQVQLKAKSFDAVILGPFLKDVFSQIRGEVDAELAATLKTVRNEAGERELTGEIRGHAGMQDGTLALAILGTVFRQVDFRAEAERLGENATVIYVRDLEAAVRSESPNLTASATLYLDGLSLARASAAAQFGRDPQGRKRDPVPLALEGVSQADLAGRASVELVRHPKELVDVTIEIPELEAKLARSSGRNVLSTAPNKNIAILQPLSEPVAQTSEGSLPWKVRFVLGRDVRVVRSDLDIPLTGEPVLRIGEELEVSGEIRLERGGRIQLAGKSFVIDNGYVRFDTADPSNPSLNVTATWRAPDGTTLYVRVTGTVLQAKLDLSSDRAMSEAELQALLLGGPTASGKGAGGTATTGVGIGAGLIGDIFADTPLSVVQFRTATTGEEGISAAYSTYSAAVRLSDEVWFEATYKRTDATIDPGLQSGVSGTIDWRFRENWSLRTEIGTIGAGADLLWQYRY